MANELRSDSLPVREHWWQALYESPDLAGECSFSLLVQQGSHSEPAGDYRLSRLS